MKNLLLSCLLFLVANPALSAMQYYHFSNQNTDFVLGVDFNQPGYYYDTNGNTNYFAPDPNRETFFAEYMYGTFSLAPTSNKFQRFYGENGMTPEGWQGDLNVLNSLSLQPGATYIGKVQSWAPGQSISVSLYDSMSGTAYDGNAVVLTSITNTLLEAPLPSSLILLLSGIGTLRAFLRRKN